MTSGERPDYMLGGLFFAGAFQMDASPSLYPSAALLSTWSEHDWQRANGVQLETLEHMQRVMVRTRNSVYEIFVREGTPGSVLVRGGRFFQDFTEAHVSGSSLGSGFLKQYGIYVGLQLEFNVDGETIITSPVFSISISPLSPIASA